MNYVNLCGIPNRSIRITYRPLPLPFLLQDYRGAPILQSFLRCIKYLVSVWRKSSSDYVPGTAWAPLGRAWAISPKIHLLVDSHMCASIEAPGSQDEMREIHIYFLNETTYFPCFLVWTLKRSIIEFMFGLEANPTLVKGRSAHSGQT